MIRPTTARLVLRHIGVHDAQGAQRSHGGLGRREIEQSRQRALSKI